MEKIGYLKERDLKGLDYYDDGLISGIGYHSRAELAMEIKRKYNLQDKNIDDVVEVYYDRGGLLEERGLSLYSSNGKYYLNGNNVNQSFSSLDDLFRYVGENYMIYLSPLEEIYKKRVITEEYVLKKDEGHLAIQFIKTIITSKKDEKVSVKVRCGADNLGWKYVYDLDQEIDDLIYPDPEMINESKPFQKRSVYTFNEKNLIEYYDDLSIERSIYLSELDSMSDKLKLYLDTFGSLEMPFFITIGGVPSKLTREESEKAFDFLLKSGLRGTYIENPVDKTFQSLKSREEKLELLKNRPNFNASICASMLEKINASLKDGDFVLCDQGLLECFIWENMFYQCGLISKEDYENFLKSYPIPKECQKVFYSLFKNYERETNAQNAFISDMKDNLYIRPRLTKTLEVLNQYDKSYADIMPYFAENGVQVKDASNISGDVIESMLTLQRKR